MKFVYYYSVDIILFICVYMSHIFRPIAAIVMHMELIQTTPLSICYTSLHCPVFSHSECVVQVCRLYNSLMLQTVLNNNI
jgi:hypothetical protein